MQRIKRRSKRGPKRKRYSLDDCSPEVIKLLGECRTMSQTYDIMRILDCGYTTVWRLRQKLAARNIQRLGQRGGI